MTERKVINKYFPPDYDPSKIPRIRKGDKRRQFNIRTMAPFNMRCTTCNGYIYKAKKFNSRMETAENVDYLGLRHYRFYIRCPSCCAEIIWRTDLESGDYVLEAGAKRNFEALKTAEELEAKRQAEEEEELANNPMKLLEKRTDQSKQEMEMVEVIEDLKQLNKRQAGMEADHVLLRQLWQEEEAQKKAEEEADEALIKEMLASRSANGQSSTEQDSAIPLESHVDKVVVIEPTVPVPKAPRPLTTSKTSATSYLKRQLMGVCVRPKQTGSTSSASHAPQASSSTAPSGSPNSEGPPSAKLSRLGQTDQSGCKASSAAATGEQQREQQEQPGALPGITYSDHSDSD